MGIRKVKIGSGCIEKCVDFVEQLGRHLLKECTELKEIDESREEILSEAG